jgi:hypothetical protein
MPQRAFVGLSTQQIRLSSETGTLQTATVTVSGVAHDGATVTLGPVSTVATGVYQASMTVTTPTSVTLTWSINGTPIQDSVDVVSGPYVTVDELRATHASLASTDTTLLANAIQDAEAEAQALTGASWRRRYDVIEVTGRADGLLHIAWPWVRRIGKVTVIDEFGTSAVLSSAQWQTMPASRINVPGVGPSDRVEIGFEHGAIEPNREIRRAVLIRARQLAQADASKIPLYSERVVMDSSGSTLVRLLPKADSTGVAEVDAIYQRHRHGMHLGFGT